MIHTYERFTRINDPHVRWLRCDPERYHSQIPYMSHEQTDTIYESWTNKLRDIPHSYYLSEISYVSDIWKKDITHSYYHSQIPYMSHEQKNRETSPYIPYMSHEQKNRETSPYIPYMSHEQKNRETSLIHTISQRYHSFIRVTPDLCMCVTRDSLTCVCVCQCVSNCVGASVCVRLCDVCVSLTHTHSLTHIWHTLTAHTHWVCVSLTHTHTHTHSHTRSLTHTHTRHTQVWVCVKLTAN